MIEVLLVAEQLLADGALDRAEHLFAQVAEADPRNAIAVAGLARVALANGNRPQALVLARRALAIDPDEAAALRLIAELEVAEPRVAGPGVAEHQGADHQGADLPNQFPPDAGPGTKPGPADRAPVSWWTRILRAIGRRN